MGEYGLEALNPGQSFLLSLIFHNMLPVLHHIPLFIRLACVGNGPVITGFSFKAPSRCPSPPISTDTMPDQPDRSQGWAKPNGSSLMAISFALLMPKELHNCWPEPCSGSLATPTIGSFVAETLF
jgi:hypothetical protein